MSARSFGFRPAVTGEVAGCLQLAVARHGRVTRPIKTESRGVMRLMRPLYLDDSGQVTYFIINPGGAYSGKSTRSTWKSGRMRICSYPVKVRLAFTKRHGSLRCRR